MAITYAAIEQLPRLESVSNADLLPVSHEGGAAAVPASLFKGADGDKGDKGDDATINGFNAVNFQVGSYMSLDQSGNTFTMDVPGLNDAVAEAKAAGQKAIDYINDVFQSLDEASEAMLYDTPRGKIVLINGAFLECSVKVDKEYAGQSVYLTHISGEGEITEAYEVSNDGLVFEYLPLADGYNLITVTQTDPSGKGLPAADAIDCVVRYIRFKRRGATESAISWSEFLTARGLSCAYIETETPEDFTSDAYFTRQHTDDTLIWDDLNTSDGDYYMRIYSAPDNPGAQIYTWSFTRIAGD